MPVNRAWDVEELFRACHGYFEKTGRRISFEYAMIDGVNDHDWQADLLARKLRGMPGHVNLIPLNDVVESPLQALQTGGGLSEAAGVPRHHRHRAAEPGRRYRRLLRTAPPEGHAKKRRRGEIPNEPNERLGHDRHGPCPEGEPGRLRHGCSTRPPDASGCGVVCDGMGGAAGGQCGQPDRRRRPIWRSWRSS